METRGTLGLMMKEFPMTRAGLRATGTTTTGIAVIRYLIDTDIIIYTMRRNPPEVKAALGIGG